MTETQGSRRKDSQLRKDIVRNTSMQEESPQEQHNNTLPHLSLQGQTRPLLHGPSSSVKTERNIKFKLEQLGEQLEELMAEARGARDQCRQLRDQTSLLKSSLVYDTLYGLKQEMEGKCQAFSNCIRGSQHSSEQRYSQIRLNCTSIWESTENLRESLFQLDMGMERLELKLGFKEAYRLSSY